MAFQFVMVAGPALDVDCGQRGDYVSNPDFMLWLPQYAEEIPNAAARLAEHERHGTRVRQMEGYEGAARLHTRTVEEMAAAKEESRANAQAADKGKMTTNA